MILISILIDLMDHPPQPLRSRKLMFTPPLFPFNRGHQTAVSDWSCNWFIYRTFLPPPSCLSCQTLDQRSWDLSHSPTSTLPAPRIPPPDLWPLGGSDATLLLCIPDSERTRQVRLCILDSDHFTFCGRRFETSSTFFFLFTYLIDVSIK